MTCLLSADNHNSEIELVTLVEEKIPKYKLRLDPLTQFAGKLVRCVSMSLLTRTCPGYRHNDWGVISTPLVDPNSPLDPSPVVIYETLNYFIQSGERVSQMTKVYDDVDAVTKLLEEVSSIEDLSHC